MNKKLLAAIFGSALMLAACGGNEDAAEPVEEDGGEATETVDAEAVVQASCVSCHGGNLEGQGNFPAINDIGARLSEEEILAVIENGQGAMPANVIKGEEATAVAAWLATKK